MKILIEQQQVLSSLQNEISNNKKSFENYNNTISKLDNNIQQLTSNIAKSVGFFEELDNEKNQIEIKLKSLKKIILVIRN